MMVHETEPKRPGPKKKRPVNFTKPIPLRLERDVREIIEGIAYRQRRTMADVIRILIEDQLSARGLFDPFKRPGPHSSVKPPEDSA